MPRNRLTNARPRFGVQARQDLRVRMPFKTDALGPRDQRAIRDGCRSPR